MRLDPFYLIVDDAEWLRAAAASRREARAIAGQGSPGGRSSRANSRGARAVPGNSARSWSINDYWRLALEEGCDFVHLGQGDLDGADIAALRAKGVRLGVSTHDEAELDRALSLSPDYIALGPVYPTLLKKMSFAPQGLESLGDWKRRSATCRLVAIGGLTPERARLVLRAGADSAASSPTFCATPSPKAARANGSRRRRIGALERNLFSRRHVPSFRGVWRVRPV